MGKRVRTVGWKGDIRSRIELIGKFIDVTSENELDIIELIYNVKEGQPVALSMENRLNLCVKKGMKLNTFNIALGRLTKRGIIKKVGHTFALHPVFVDIGKEDEFTIVWQSPESTL